MHRTNYLEDPVGSPGGFRIIFPVGAAADAAAVASRFPGPAPSTATLPAHRGGLVIPVDMHSVKKTDPARSASEVHPSAF